MIDFGYAMSPLEGRSGDRVVIAPHAEGALVGVIDGLGHGEEAGEAAERAARAIEAGAGRATLGELLRECHARLERTRGAVMTLAEFEAGAAQLTWMGVGNVEGRLLSGPPAQGRGAVAATTLFGGVVGHNLPAVRASSHPLSAGDVVVLATDGIRADFAVGLPTGGSARAVAERVLERGARGDDDALVAVVRWMGEAQ